MRRGVGLYAIAFQTADTLGCRHYSASRWSRSAAPEEGLVVTPHMYTACSLTAMLALDLYVIPA